MKSQSTLEFIMSYGWALSIIALVMFYLFYIGAFNPLYLTPKLAPGGCSVFRPQGMGTVDQIALTGTCSGGISKFIISAAALTIQVPSVNYTPAISSAGQNSITITAWASTNAIRDSYLFVYGPNPGCCGSYYPGVMDEEFLPGGPPGSVAWSIAGIATSGASYTNDQATMFTLPGMIKPNTMTFYAITYNGLSITHYYVTGGGTLSSLTSSISLGGAVIPANASLFIGQWNSAVNSWSGGISNVQMYRTALNANSISALYYEGMVGAPIDLQDLVGWWPLNGDIKDYSGNVDNGNAISGSLIYSDQWWRSITYTTPT